MVENKTATEILNGLLGSVSDEISKLQGYLTQDLLNAVSISLADLYVQLSNIEKQIDVDNLTGADLEKFVDQRKAIKRTLATYAVGGVTVTGNGTVNIGDLFETKSGVQFKATETKAIVNSGVVAIQGVIAGSTGNVPTNQIVQMPVTLTGITSVINSAPTTGGYDAESDIALRNRYYSALKNPSTSGNKAHYLQWAKEVSGVGDAKVFPLERGDLTVEVVIIDQSMLPANATLVSDVQTYIDPNSTGVGDGKAPIGAKCYIVSATPLTINVSVTVVKMLGYSDATVLANIQQSVTNYLKTLFYATYVSYAKIGEAILDSDGVNDYSNLLVNNGTTNITIGSKSMPVLGVVTIA